MKRLLGLSLFSILMLFYGSCNIINPDEPIPTFIQIDSFNLRSVDPAKHGSISDNITDAWVYINGSNVGNFQLPATVPFILEEGADSADVSIYGGIKVNGFSSSRRRYIFYEPYSGRVASQPGKTENITPPIQYRSTNNYELIEGFETGNSFVATDNSDTSITKTTDPLYIKDGSNAGLIYLDGVNKSSSSVTVQNFSLPSDRESFMELDYKGDLPFTIDAQVSFPGTPTIIFEVLSLNIREDWNKVYITLTDIGTTLPGRNVNFIIKTSLPVSQNTGFVAIDNLKIITQ